MINRGYITLISVLVVGAIGLAASLSLILLGTDSSRTSFAGEQSSQAKALADACAEEALREISESSSYTGNDSISLGQGTCAYDVTSQGGGNRTIEASGTVGSVVRKVEVLIDAVSPQINISSWQEVADFSNPHSRHFVLKLVIDK